MFQSALVCVKPSALGPALLDYAIALATRQKMELDCVSVVDASFVAPPEPVPIGGGTFKKEKDEGRIAGVRVAAEQAIAACKAACSSVGLAAQAAVCEGDAIAEISRRVQAHDLLIVGHSGGDDAGDASRLVKLLKHSPRPALVVPRSSAAGDAIVMAYDGSMQAARTLATLAYSGFAAGRTVHVASFDADAQRAADLAELACRFLARHGLTTTAHAKTPVGNIARMLTDLAAGEGAGLVAMGAFGKSFAREFFFGSITRSMLGDLRVPVLLDQ